MTDQTPHPPARPEREQYPTGDNKLEDALDFDPGQDALHDEDQPLDDISEYQADALQLYINHIRDMLGLSHWDVFLAATKANPGARASIHPVVGRRVAPLRIYGAEWFNSRSTDRRNDILHELIHVAHNDLTEVWRLGIGATGALNERLWNGLYTLFCNEAELMTDQLATHLAPLFPLMEDIPEVAEQLAWHQKELKSDDEG